jgi:hypothetical protein
MVAVGMMGMSETPTLALHMLKICGTHKDMGFS